MSEPSAKQVEKFLKDFMETQRRFANERKNQNTNRLEEARELLEKHVAEETSDAN